MAVEKKRRDNKHVDRAAGDWRGGSGTMAPPDRNSGR